jgi:sec-independent protein translocase protein TatB
MFDIGFSELIVIGIVALVVIGPERLPRVARTAGLLLGRMQRYVNEVKADIHREMQLDELKKLQSDVQQSVRDFERGLTDEMRAIERAVDSVGADLRPAASSSDRGSDTPADEQPPRPVVKE